MQSVSVCGTETEGRRATHWAWEETGNALMGGDIWAESWNMSVLLRLEEGSKDISRGDKEMHKGRELARRRSYWAKSKGLPWLTRAAQKHMARNATCQGPLCSLHNLHCILHVGPKVLIWVIWKVSPSLAVTLKQDKRWAGGGWGYSKEQAGFSARGREWVQCYTSGEERYSNTENNCLDSRHSPCRWWLLK